MDMKKVMVIINGEDKTLEIQDFTVDKSSNKVIVTYKSSNKPYKYNRDKVDILVNPKVINLEDKILYINDRPNYEAKYILNDFDKYRIYKCNGEVDVVKSDEFYFVDKKSEYDNILDYFKTISKYKENKYEEKSFLEKEMNKLNYVHPKSVLSIYLSEKSIESRKIDINRAIFPFSFNLSQKKALENALESPISIIEGPPGTGKTQTILNIVSNIVTIQGKSVAVVSNNNEAIKNVIEKLKNPGYSFLTALLGKNDNKEEFFKNMPMPEVSGWNIDKEENILFEEIKNLNSKLNDLQEKDREKYQLINKLRAWKLEQEHFENYFNAQNVEYISKLPLLCKNPDKLMSFIAETNFAKDNDKTKKILYKIKLFLKYGVLDFKYWSQNEISTLLSLQRKFYFMKIKEFENRLKQLDKELENASFDKMLKDHQEYSEKIFKKSLYLSHGHLKESKITKKDYKNHFNDFIKRFPIIFSTTHSLRASIPEDYMLDYVIIDEASQVDLLTGVLALSCCKNVVIVGDTKQLPQITNIKIKIDPPSNKYNYFENNILTSMLKLEKSIPCVTLREHYRCHPQIIEFCNQEYYDGQLIPYTDSDSSNNPLIIYKTSKGNHMRKITNGDAKGTYNQRELDVIKEEVLKNKVIDAQSEDIGIVTPYRKQADKAMELLDDSIQSDTVHKYQGREKKSIIMSTVLDKSCQGKIGINFVDDPKIINVGVSRAIKQFVLVTHPDSFSENGKNISNLIRYIEYNTLDENVINSQVVSVFDLLYKEFSDRLLPIKEKMNSNAKYKSEEVMRVTLDGILNKEQYNSYGYSQGVFLRNLLKDTKLLTKEEEKFVNNRSSLDFIIFRRQDRSCILVIEVDGFSFHENKPEQLKRDKLKNIILKKYGIPILRLPTNGSVEGCKVEDAISNAEKETKN